MDDKLKAACNQWKPYVTLDDNGVDDQKKPRKWSSGIQIPKKKKVAAKFNNPNRRRKK